MSDTPSSADDRPPAGDATPGRPGAAPAGVDVEFSPNEAPGFAAIVRLHGEHDLATSAELRATLEPIAGDLLVDLSDCAFLDSTIIGVLLAKLRDSEREGRRLELVVPSANGPVSRISEVVGLGSLVTVHERLPGNGAG
jgi:anti-anti-sigma factor